MRSTRVRRGAALIALFVLCTAVGAVRGDTVDMVNIRGHQLPVHLYGVRGGGPPVLISSGDGGWIHLGPRVAEYPNVLFDTSWWQISDMLTLFTSVPPGQILYASDMPYGSPRFPSFLMLRTARAVGLTQAQLNQACGDRSTQLPPGLRIPMCR